ncbi:hypothetical protein [Altericroceibacterium endophyticum]|uniref:Uncharacterized protein n=1 Tax=Altericroceibacterium endophyticum TaxID=1808508 RepID=A0A6I4T822_9SPHN|nr:hypothetical protein [Altericroceibacterium endophyticum]MXO66251.1 hypothetical protein [Altericroceibacterium endophyticum]
MIVETLPSQDIGTEWIDLAAVRPELANRACMIESLFRSGQLLFVALQDDMPDDLTAGVHLTRHMAVDCAAEHIWLRGQSAGRVALAFIA